MSEKNIVKVKIKEGITEIDGLEVRDGYIELPRYLAIQKIINRPEYYLNIEEGEEFKNPQNKRNKKEVKEWL